MARAMRRLGRLRTSVGRVDLKVSIGVHSGVVELFLLPGRHRELVIAGPGATRTVEMEATAGAGEVVVSNASATLLDAGVLGEPRGGGILLVGEPHADEWPAPALEVHRIGDADVLVPERLRSYLASADEHPEHRPIAICFVQLAGLDAFIGQRGAAARGAPARHASAWRPGRRGPPRGDLLRNRYRFGRGQDRAPRRSTHPRRERRGPRTAQYSRHRLPGSERGTSVGPSTSKTLTTGPLCGCKPGSTWARHSCSRAFALAVAGSFPSRETQSIWRRVSCEPRRPVRCAARRRRGRPSRAPFSLRPLDPFSAKGKAEPVITYAVSEEGGRRPSAPPSQPTFVGRTEELKLLLAAGAEVRGSTNGKVVEVIGPAGIGKSRLIDEAASGWRLPTWRTPCDAFGGGRPYRPLRPMARALLGLEDDAPRAHVASVLNETLEERVPALLPWDSLLADVFDVVIPARREVEELEPRFRRRRLEAAFVELAGRLAPNPTAFVFEDTHGLDQASSSLVLRLAEETEVRPWLVVATHRPDGGGALDRDLAGRLTVHLDPLDGAASEHLVSDLGDDSLGPRERHVLVERAAGNPLFLLELARAVRVTGSPEALPDSLEPLLVARVDRLSPVDRQALRAAAVLGLRFDDELLANVLDDAELVDKGLWARLSEFVRDEAGERVFTHALLRDAAYEGLSFRRRRELHARAAAAIEQRAKGAEAAVELLSLHWLAAERWDRAWECARLAGEKAVVLYSNADAATHFRRALDAAQHIRDLPTAEVARVSELLGDANELAGAYEKARSAYARAYKRVSDAVDRARLLRKVGVLHERRGGYPQALRCYTGALRRLDGDAGTVQIERCELELARAGVRHRQWKLADSAAAAAAAGEVATIAGYRSGLAHSLYLRHINSVYLNEPDDELAHAALEIFVELGDLVGQGNVLNNLGISAYYRGAWDEALEHYGASRDARGADR